MYLALFQEQGWQTLFCPLHPQPYRIGTTPLVHNGTVYLDSPQALETWLTQYGKAVTVTWLGRPFVAEAFLPAVRRHTSAPVVYFTHDIHYIRLQREAAITGDEHAATQAAALKRIECSIFESVDSIIAPGYQEVAVIREAAPHKPVTAIPLHFYGEQELVTRSAEHFAPLTHIVFVGGFNHRPNVDAALFLAKSVMPLIWQQRPDAVLDLVGHSVPPSVSALASKRIVVSGAVPDVTPYYDRARLTLLGLRYGAGVKGKALEALRLGVPMCGTPIAVEGIGLVPGRDALVADNPEGLAAHAIALLNDTALCHSLSEAGVALIRRSYTASVAMAALGKLGRFDRSIQPPPPTLNE